MTAITKLKAALAALEAMHSLDAPVPTGHTGGSCEAV